MVFLVGYTTTTAGLMIFGGAARRAAFLGRWSSLPLATGVVGLLWPFLAEVSIVLNVLVQVLFGLGWVGLGYFLWAGRGAGSATAPDE